MIETEASRFEARFSALTGYSPMLWQHRLFQRFTANDVPKVCDIPTGLGKTYVLAVWLLAVVQQEEAGELRLPRRLVYIVNRRTVVDQATDVVRRMRARLLQPNHDDWRMHADCLSQIAGVLRRLGASGQLPLAVSTLRGELADNEEWKADPARPAIVIGTIDMIGSKLLFSGYGDGRYGRPHHAGLIGQDVLIVHDEAHLTPAFGGLLHSVADEQRRETQRDRGGDIVARPIRILELSATSRGTIAEPFTLDEEDKQDGIVQDRLTASKRLHLHPAAENELIEKIVKAACEHKDVRARVLIFVRSPEHAKGIGTALEKALGSDGSQRIAMLTGTIRGYERDQLMQETPTSAAARVIRHFLDGTQPEHTVYVVSTSAGEVGIDLDADHMVCDLTTLDSMIQRLGRVNRRGGNDRRAHVDSFGNSPAGDALSEFDRAVASTCSILERWKGRRVDGIDVSAENLRRLVEALSASERASAFSPTPEALHLTDILLDGWSLTSVHDMPGVAEVAAFLHGVTNEPAETYVAWRREVTLLSEAQTAESELRDWFRVFPIESRERLRDRTDRLRVALASLLREHRKRAKKDDLDFRVVLLDERGRARWSALSELVQNQDERRLRYQTLVVPVEAGGLDERGMFDPGAVTPSEGLRLDVAEADGALDGRQRWICRGSDGFERYERVDTGEILDALPHGLREKVRVPLTQAVEGEELVEPLDLLLLVSPRRSACGDPETTSARQGLEEHSTAAVSLVSAMAERLRLPEPIHAALVTAARWHDKGKDRRVWQRYARNTNGAETLAKSEKYLHPRALGGYRHEFGSLLDATADAEIQKHPERDLVLHLIAAHHGWGRPHFEPRSFDNTRSTVDNEKAAIEAMRRFDRLQQRFGRWGLAWLESLLRCADIAASQAAAGEVIPSHLELEARM